MDTKRNHDNLKIIFGIVVILSLTLLTFIGYQHGDSTAYGTGQEVGSLFRSFSDFIKPTGAFSIGTIIAVLLSWDKNNSVRWAVLHAFFGWAYVIYYLFTRKTAQVELA